MKPKEIEFGEEFRIFYNNPDMEDDSSLVLNIWDQNGKKLNTDLPYTSQIPGTEVYYFTRTAPSYPVFLLCLVSDDSGSSRPYIFKVDDPEDRIFYWAGRSRQTIRYQLFDEISVIEEGLLTELPGEFYTAEVFSTRPWFVEFLDRAIEQGE